jgi:ribonuclease HI
MSQLKVTDIFDLETNEEIIESDYYVYTDGACSNNGRENAMAGIGIFLGQDDPRNVSELVEGKQSNNTAELTAIIKTWPIIEKDILDGKKVTIVSDSIYAIRCVSSYGEKCAQSFWKKDIPNKELVKVAYEIYKDNKNVEFMHIKAHTDNQDIHSIGNDGADRLANKAIGLDSCPYTSPEKIYLNVSYHEKDKVKALGGRWDPKKKKWYIFDDNNEKDNILESYT